MKAYIYFLLFLLIIFVIMCPYKIIEGFDGSASKDLQNLSDTPQTKKHRKYVENPEPLKQQLQECQTSLEDAKVSFNICKKRLSDNDCKGDMPKGEADLTCPVSLEKCTQDYSTVQQEYEETISDLNSMKDEVETCQRNATAKEQELLAQIASLEEQLRQAKISAIACSPAINQQQQPVEQQTPAKKEKKKDVEGIQESYNYRGYPMRIIIR